MKMLRNILTRIILACTLIFATVPALCENSNIPNTATAEMADVGESGLYATENTDSEISGYIGNYGSWATKINRNLYLSSLRYDIEQFQGNSSTQLVDNYVPIEAKIGLAFMNAFSHIAHILDSSLVRFTIIFIIIAYGFWLFFEAYTIISGQSKVPDKIKEMAKNGLKVGTWVAILSIGPAEIFMMLISPIMYIGTLLSDIILNATSSVSGVSLPNTCKAIQDYAVANISQDNIIDPISAANIMCVPTRLSGFCYTAIKMGWGWIASGIGGGAFAILCGLGFVVGFIYLAWKFAFIAFGVIADLFLGIIMLPFTAIAETTAKTTYKGIAGNIFNNFLKLFTTESLSVQISRFTSAALHFVAMSIIIAICAALLSTVINTNNASTVPEINDQGFWITLLMSALTWWLAKKASDFATEIGGKISYDMGTALQKDANNLWSSTKKGAKTLIKIIRSSK